MMSIHLKDGKTNVRADLVRRDNATVSEFDKHPIMLELYSEHGSMVLYLSLETAESLQQQIRNCLNELAYDELLRGL